MTDDSGLIGRLAEPGAFAGALETIAGLSDIDRTILELCAFEGYTPSEVAELLGTSPARVVKRMERTTLLLTSARAA